LWSPTVARSSESNARFAIEDRPLRGRGGAFGLRRSRGLIDGADG
jgi:hypothetical protein